MLKSFFIAMLLFQASAQADDISLTIEEFDSTRNRASLLVMDSSQVPLQTLLRVHGKTGSCEITIVEKVNDHLIGSTSGCQPGVITPGMKLAYSQPAWDQPARLPSSETNQVSSSYDSPDLVAEVLKRTSVYLGHNFAGELEGNVYSDGRLKNLDGDTAFSLGIKGRVYDFTPRLFLTTELGYETPRTLDRATYTFNGVQSTVGTQGYSPRLSLWSLSVLGEARLMEQLIGFAGINYSIPSLSNAPFDISGDIGFQGGATFYVLPKIAVEGLVKITNMNLKNNVGETTDVSLAGLELRGRYSF